MKALVIAERQDAARELAAGARTMADEVVLVSFGEAPEGVADKVARISAPEGAVLDDAADTVIAVFDAEAPSVVLVEPTRHMKTVAGKLAAHAGASVITDVMSFDDGAKSLYFGGVAERVQKPATDVAFYTVSAGTFAGLEASGANAVEDVAWVAPANPVKLLASKPIEKSGVDLFKADAVVAAGRGFAEEADLDLARAMEQAGVSTIIYTDISKDGTLSGPNLAELTAIDRAVSCNIVASGGISSLDDIIALRKLGLYGAICGKSLYQGTLNLKEAIRAAGEVAAC